MRADRLLSLLMLLQSRERMTARQLARELEVSERTIYRDIDALCQTGVPLYRDPGRQGGYSLLNSYRTSLTGLTERELRALFMLSIPSPLVELGLDQYLKAALRKLSAALPAARRENEAHIRQRFYLDSAWWHQPPYPVPHLQTVHRAVSIDQQIILRYRLPSGVETCQLVEPYGLVAKAGAWYLVYAIYDKLRVRRVSDLLDVQMIEVSFTRQTSFDLVDFWHAWCEEQEQQRYQYPVIVRSSNQFLPHLAHLIYAQLLDQPKFDPYTEKEDWTIVKLGFPTFEAARETLLGYGRSVEVLEPLALRRSILDYAKQIVELYIS